MKIKPYTIVIDPEITEIDAENWYESGMLEIEPDIVPLLSNPQHPIFNYQWNAQNWIQQFRKLDLGEQRPKGYDRNRHLLRVTVMLNTIGVLRKQRYKVNNEEIVLKQERMQTIIYDHKSKLSSGTEISVKNLKPPYASTFVKVVNEDCLIIYEKLVSEGRRPLLLNMANKTNPGGGDRKGDGAQEENLFRRSNYYQSLDIEIADNDRSERLHCNDKCELTKISKLDSFYPMDEFGAIYTTGITVFRQTESSGYAFMKTPLYNVCAIAMAAHREPKLKNNRTLENKFAATTQKKIENIFAIAHHHKHDCLVLSAFGCGAFKNPPGHIASIFKSVIYQYAGFFNTIYFAIVDDHNTGNKINPQGNLIPFQEILDGLVVSSPTNLCINAAIGPNRILDKLNDEQLTLSDVCILALPPCHHGAKCRDCQSPDHKSRFSHPPMCPLSKATSSCEQLNDDIHAYTLTHNTKCKYGGQCNDNSPLHLLQFDHPEFCEHGGDCTNMTKKHLLAYRHISICPDGLKCQKYRRRDYDHSKAFRHCKPVCSDDNCCINLHNKEHLANFIHSFRPPCPFTPYNCLKYIEFVQTSDSKGISEEVESHCFDYSHICPYGRYCKNTEEIHFEISIHIARQLCPDDNKCSKLTHEDHLESYSHPDIRDIRLLCKIPGYQCSNRFDDLHFKKYRHNENHDHFSVAPSSNLNSLINFARNQSQLIKTVNTYIDRMNWEKAKISQEILNWIRALQPVHRCRKEIFESILVLGHVMSRRYMSLLNKPENVVRAVQQHSQVRSIFLRYNTPVVKENMSKLIEILIDIEFAKAKSKGKFTSDSDYDQRIHTMEQRLQPPLSNRNIQVIHEWTTKIAQASIKLSNIPMGIGTGQVTLTHAGPNSIYNREKIECQFKKADLDLSKLDYIHLSAGTEDVPVRNLTINFEQIPQLHPPVDVQFKNDTSNLIERCLLTSSYANPSAPTINQSKKQRPSAINPLPFVDTSFGFKRMGDILLCRRTNVVEPKALDDASPVLKPCQHSVYCLLQNSSKHAKLYSHPCPFSELCTRKTKEPYRTHERHNVLKCAKDKYCLEKGDPVHRARYRHTNLPDYLLPCRKQNNCSDKSPKHRMKYFHGETLPLITRKSSLINYIIID
ncbi:unnamed protein product [Rotaria sp. Silwood1]|nr:unnamed protein product [Rotaria sp. Silwood1]